MEEKTAGILGGMGPEATVDLMRRIIAHTDARDDVDHVRCIVDNNPKVPSRIKALLEGDGISPGPCLADMARRLEAWGADFLCMACNTAHMYYGEVKAAVTIPALNMIELAARRRRKARARRSGGHPGFARGADHRPLRAFLRRIGAQTPVCRRPVGTASFADDQRGQGGAHGSTGARRLYGNSRSCAEQRGGCADCRLHGARGHQRTDRHAPGGCRRRAGAGCGGHGQRAYSPA